MISKDSKISIFGLGHIGLPTAALFTNSGFNVHGVDINQETVNIINSGKSPFKEPGLLELLKNAVKDGKLCATTDGMYASKNSDIKIVIVPTPVDEYQNADLYAVISVCKIISKTLKKDDLVIIESTIPQGTCDDLIIPILEDSGLKSGKDFSIVYTPERAIPNKTIYEITHNPRVIGGIDHKSTKRAAELYQNIMYGPIIKVKNLITAETVKLIENTYRDVNIALSNEIAIICEKLNVDAIEAIQAANHHPRVNLHTPGPGVGGHCISIDPYFVVETAAKNGISADLIKTSRIINEKMPLHVVELVSDAFTEKGRTIKNSKIGILGVAYKGNVADIRETPAKKIINILKELGAKTYAHDPHAPSDAIESLDTTPGNMETIFDCDCVILLTDHDEYKKIKPKMIKNGILICTRPILNPEEFFEEGIIFKGVGRINKIF
jgi:UDP-N-acetyl-D-mannosaminuronic acid dehydrogenase